MNNHERFGNNVNGNFKNGENVEFGGFDQKKAEENIAQENMKTEAAEKLTENIRSKLEIVGADITEDPLQFFYDLRKSELISDDDLFNYVLDAKTPANELKDGYHGFSNGEDPWKMACNAQYNLQFSKMKDSTLLHSQRILAMFSGGRFNAPEDADGDSYRVFLERYPSALDFDKKSEEFIKNIGVWGENVNSEASIQKRDEYARDMKVFKKAMYGEQQDRLDSLKKLDEEAKRFGRLTQNVRLAFEIQNGRYGRSVESNEHDEFDGGNEESDMTEEPVFQNEPKFEDDLGNGYKCASFGFKNKDEAYAGKVDNEDVVFYKGKWYRAIRNS